jgi:hypothetical protein
MYTLIRNLKSKSSVMVEAPSCLASFIIAEVFYKFHSFTLECIAFLATWLVLSTALSWITRQAGRVAKPITL